MRSGPNQASLKLRQFWRRLVGAVAIYALAMQPLLLTVAGTQLAQASVLDQVTFAELCLHNADGSPVAPADREFHKLHQSGRSLRLSSLSQYSVARPRGPPLSA